MAEYEIARWLTPGLTPVRLVFTSYGGSTHGEVELEVREDGEWVENQNLGGANGIPEAKGEKISEKTINQFTGKKS